MRKKLIRATDIGEIQIPAVAPTDPDNPSFTDEEIQKLRVRQLEELAEQEIRERRKTGRYLLDEAARFIADNAPINGNYILMELKKSATTGELPVYKPDSITPYEPKPKVDLVYVHGSSNPIEYYIPTWHVEVRWSDLNKWLQIMEPIVSINYRFPNPQNLTSLKSHESVRGISKQKIMFAFDGIYFDSARWGKYLASQPKWLKECCVAKGKRGDNKISGLWNPVQIAIALIDKGVAIKKLDNIFAVHLKDWDSEWSEQSEYVR